MHMDGVDYRGGEFIGGFVVCAAGLAGDKAQVCLVFTYIVPGEPRREPVLAEKSLKYQKESVNIDFLVRMGVLVTFISEIQDQAFILREFGFLVKSQNCIEGLQ